MKKTLILSLYVLTVSEAYALSENYDVVVRKKNGGVKVSSESLDLKARDRFESQNFKVTWKKEDEAITLDRMKGIVEERKKSEREKPPTADETRITVRDEETLRLLSANAIYHAEKARKYFIENLKSEEVKKLEPVVIRLDLTNRFSASDHFTNDNHQPQYNNALSIEGNASRGWNREIWFRPRKEIPIREILAKFPENPMNSQIREARQILYPMQIDTALQSTLYATFQSRLDSPGFIDSVTRQAGTLLLMEGAFQVLKVVNRVIIPQKFYLDSGLVPEIIYHEFSHLALSDYMKPDLSTPVNEGMADYFAASISGSPKLAKKIRDYSTAVGKNGKKRQQFQIEMESTGKAQADFVLGLLWGLREPFGETNATRIVFEARKYVDTKNSDIRVGLIRALLKACDNVCESPLYDRMVIHQYLQGRGL